MFGAFLFQAGRALYFVSGYALYEIFTKPPRQFARAGKPVSNQW
ncbi:hypothetical protein PS645_01227 [Pseudomonas fluorescens]|uniref:Uncharacterized protein n=1 Tax=Pseudomonas fluorescens TaxID=294 RepID=A0A5E6QYW0_PSEFL|nr:hypothetical protein PS645_01227 [Pseudomonas fluorescens]